MGVACGPPQSVSVDHMGRADYHGHAINMAARWGAAAPAGNMHCSIDMHCHLLSTDVHQQWTVHRGCACE